MQSQSVHMTHALGPGNHDQVFGWALSQKHMEREILNGWFIQKVRFEGNTNRLVDPKCRFFQILVAEYVAMILVFMTSRF